MPEIARNEPVTPDNALTPDSMTPPTSDERERQKSYAQLRNEQTASADEQEREKLRLRAERQALPDKLSIVVQGHHVAERTNRGDADALR